MTRSPIAGTHPRTIALILFAIAVFVRTAFIHTVTGLDRGAEDISILNGDERDYIRRAENLIAGNGFTAGGENDRMWRTPAYPGLLSGVFLIFNRPLTVVRLLHAMLGALACVFVFLIASRIFGSSIAILSALYFAFYPPHVYMAGQVLSENLLLPGVLAATMAFINLAGRQTFRSAVLTGVLDGLSIIVKPEYGVIVAAMVVVLWLTGGEKRFLHSAALILATVLVFSPWILRNYQLSGHFVLSSVGGEAFWGGNNEFVLNIPQHRGYWMPPSEMPEQLKQVLTAPTEYEQDRVRWRFGWDFLEKHPQDIPRLMFYKLRRFYSVLVQDPKERLVLILSFGLLLPFIAAGVLVNAWKFTTQRQTGLILIAIILCYNLLAIVFWGANRLRLVIDPMLIILGVWAVCAALKHALETMQLVQKNFVDPTP